MEGASQDLHTRLKTVIQGEDIFAIAFLRRISIPSPLSLYATASSPEGGGGVELETGKCIVELRFIILALLACVHYSLMQLKIHRFPVLHNWLSERAGGVNPVF